MGPPAPPDARAPNAPPVLKFLPTANDAIALAVADARALSPVDRVFVRYVWVTGWFGDGLVTEDGKALSFTVNTISRASIIIRPPPLGKDKLLLMRIDLRNYFPREKDLEQALQLWDDLEFDPAFSLLITRGTLAAALVQFPGLEGKAVAIKSGKRSMAKEEPVGPPEEPQPKAKEKAKQPAAKIAKRGDIALKDVKVEDIDLIKFAAPHLHQLAFAELQELTGTPAPIVTDGYFTFRVLAQIQDKGLYEILYAGLYYKFAGIQQNVAKGTDEDVLLESLGIGNVAAGVNAAKVFDTIRSDQRAALFHSNVTGSPRTVEVLPTLVGRDGSAIISITHDLKNDDIDIDTHAVANLIDFKDFAREIIWTKSNGLHGYAAVAAINGAAVDEVPANVAPDRFTRPSPFPTRLQPGISCIACHQSKGKYDGWIPAQNDVKALVGAKGKLDIFGDITKAELKKPIADTLDRLAGLYAGDLERTFQAGRDSYSAAVLKATGPMAKANAGQTDIVAVATTRVVEIWAGYYATTVDARQALKEMGIDADKDKARELFDALVPPDVRAAVDVPEVAVIVPEDPRIAALRAGLTVVRADWDLTRAFAQERLQQTIARLGANKTSRLDRQVPPVAAVGDKTNRRATHAKLIGDGLLRAAQLEQPANLAHMGLSQFVVGAFVSKDRAVDVLVVHVGFAGIPAEVAEPVVRRVVIGKVAGLHAIGTGTDERLKHELVDIALPRFPGFAVKRDAKVTGFRFDPSRDATPFTADKHARTAAAAPKAPRPQTPKGAVVANAIRREVVHEAVANRRIGSNHDVPFQQKGMLWPEPTTF